jgi:hypothetical protein
MHPFSGQVSAVHFNRGHNALLWFVRKVGRASLSHRQTLLHLQLQWWPIVNTVPLNWLCTHLQHPRPSSLYLLCLESKYLPQLLIPPACAHSASGLDYWRRTGIVSGGPYGSSEGCKPYSMPADCGVPCSMKVRVESKWSTGGPWSYLHEYTAQLWIDFANISEWIFINWLQTYLTQITEQTCKRECSSLLYNRAYAEDLHKGGNLEKEAICIKP